MDDLFRRIAAGEVLVGDGALGTMLLARGLPPGECPEAFGLAHPELLAEIAHLYVQAGADFVCTNTFGASPLKLDQYGLADRTEEINRAAVETVRKAVEDRAGVVASVGPCGKMLKPYGDTEPETVRASFSRQMAALDAAGVDAIIIETMTDLTEATLAVRAARDVSPELPVLATMTFDATPRGFFTIMGVTVPQAAAGLAEAGADAVGSNCGNGSDNMVKLAREFAGTCELPIIIQSNAGLPRTEGTSLVYDETPEFMARRATKLLDLGVSIIGGCCGTTPEHILALRHLVDART